MKLLQLSFLSLCLLTSCNMLNLDKDEDQDPFQPVFTAEINEEPFEGEGIAAITDIKQHDWLDIFADEYSKESFPYKERISFAIDYLKNDQKYKTAPDTVFFSKYDIKRTGGYYSESDGDAAISGYEALPGGNGYITVHMDTIEGDRTVVHGKFEMTVAKQYRYNKYSRREADTLHITNGRYRLLLDDEREEESR